MAHVQFTDVQSRPTEFLDLTSLTLDEFQQLVETVARAPGCPQQAFSVKCGSEPWS